MRHRSPVRCRSRRRHTGILGPLKSRAINGAGGEVSEPGGRVRVTLCARVEEEKSVRRRKQRTEILSIRSKEGSHAPMMS
jgi:hypothetical protein